MISFIPAKPGDESILGHLRQQCWTATYRGIYPDEMIDQFDYAWHTKRDLARITSPQFEVYLITEDAAPIGYMTIRRSTPPLLYSLYLLPAHQHRGIGRLALERMRNFCTEQEQPFFLCHCQPENTNAIAFYRHMGGAIIARDTANEATFMDSVTLRFLVNVTRRCRWCNPDNPRYIAYHDNEWGCPCHDDHMLFELLILEGFQAGLSWECVLNKRAVFRAAFDHFDWNKIAAYSEDKVAELLANPGIIRNRLKVRAAIHNATVFRDIRAEFGSFDAYLTRFTGGEVIVEHDKTTSELSDRISRDLHKRGMRFVGSTIIYAYLQAIGAINSHEPCCDLYIGAQKCVASLI